MHSRQRKVNPIPALPAFILVVLYPMDMGAIFAYVTTKDQDEARRIGRALVEGRLAACINILPGMESFYRWEGKLETAQECVLVIKSDASRAQDIIRMVKEMHGYSCPCVAIWPLTDGNSDYLNWIIHESVPPSGSEASP
jgi:periplasmic divalent cation tolerance protein